METIIEHLQYCDLTELKLIQITIKKRIQNIMERKRLAEKLWPENAIKK